MWINMYNNPFEQIFADVFVSLVLRVVQNLSMVVVRVMVKVADAKKLMLGVRIIEAATKC